MKFKIHICLVFSLVCSNAYAQVFKCESADGKIKYQATPCENTEDQLIVTVDEIRESKTERPEGFKISKSELLGTWTDVYPKSSLSSTWMFTGYDLTYRRYSGKVIRARYTLQKDKIIIHMPKSEFNEEAWDDVYKIIEFSGGVLTVDNVTRMKLHKL